MIRKIAVAFVILVFATMLCLVYFGGRLPPINPSKAEIVTLKGKRCVIVYLGRDVKINQDRYNNITLQELIEDGNVVRIRKESAYQDRILFGHPFFHRMDNGELVAAVPVGEGRVSSICVQIEANSRSVQWSGGVMGQ